LLIKAAALDRLSFGGDVEAIQLVLAVLKDEEHGIYKLADVKIWLLLKAIAEHFEFGRVLFQLL